jgi:hypothetical protein
VLLTRWSVVAIEIAFVAWIALGVGFAGPGGANGPRPIAIGLGAGAILMLVVAIRARRLRVTLTPDPAKLVVANLFRTVEMDATAIQSIHWSRRFRLRWSWWSVGDPLYVCIVRERRYVRRVQIGASIRSPNRDRLTALLDAWCQAHGIRFERVLEVRSTEGPAQRASPTPGPPEWLAAARTPSSASGPVAPHRASGQATLSPSALATGASTKLGPFDSPIATTLNTVIFAVGATAATGTAILLVVSLLPGRVLPTWGFVPSFLLMFPLFLWAVLVINTLVTRDRARRRFAGEPVYGRSLSFADLPQGFLRTIDKILIGVTMGVAVLCVWTATGQGNSVPIRPFLGVALVFTTASCVVTSAEHRRRKQIHLGGMLGWPLPPVAAPRLGRSRALIAWLLLSGLAFAVVGGTVAIVRFNNYGDTRLNSHGTSTVTLPGGDDVIFVGDLSRGTTPPFDPAQVRVIEVATGRRVATRWDPSSDHNSPYDVPSIGLISFTAPAAGRYRITIDGPRGELLTVARSPGAEARLVAGWIAFGVVGIGILLFGAICLVVRISWRYRTVRAEGARPRTIEEWMAAPPSPTTSGRTAYTPAAAAPGWYLDPRDTDLEWYWDGQRYTSSRRVSSSSPPSDPTETR